MTTRFRLHEILEDRGISQYALARVTGVSFATIHRITKNLTTRVDLASLDRISAHLDVEPGELLERAPERRGKKKR